MTNRTAEVRSAIRIVLAPLLLVVVVAAVVAGLVIGVVAVNDLQSSSQEGMQVPSCQSCFTEQSDGG